MEWVQCLCRIAIAKKRVVEQRKCKQIRDSADRQRAQELNNAAQERDGRLTKKRLEEEKQAEDLKQAVDKKLQHQQLEELGMRNDFLALQAGLESGEVSARKGIASVPALGSFSSLRQAVGEEVADVKEGDRQKIINPFSHEYSHTLLLAFIDQLG
jgi:altronate dehydratase